MAVYNVFVKLLDGKTANLRFTSPIISGESIKRHLYDVTRIPPQFQRLVTGCQQIEEKTLITVPGNGGFFTIHLLSRLLGGKGGFGSLLRGAATKAGQKKTNNFDACRDMSGRRLRHVNAEKRLEEWKADAEDRKLEKVAEDFIKKKVKAVKKSGSGESEKYIEKYREDSARCMEDVEASVRESFGLYEASKRKLLPSAGSASKRLKLWMIKEKANENDSDEEDEEDDKSVVLDDVNLVVRSKDGEGSSRSVSGVQSDGESSVGDLTQSNLEEENGIVSPRVIELGEISGSGVIGAEGNDSDEPKTMSHEETVSETEIVHSEGNKPLLVVESGDCKETDEQSTSISSLGAVENSESGAVVSEADDSVQEAVVASKKNSDLEKPLNFNDFNSAAELEVLGMERLKVELQARGLKCGGTLHERASRLFLLKTTPVEMLPKKLLAKK